MRFAIALFFAAVASSATAQQHWQRLQMPAASEVQQRWIVPPPEYGPEPYYGFGGAMDETVIRRDLDQLKALGFQAVTAQAGANMPYPYLSDGYFKLFHTFVEEAKKRDMRVWIVDDAGYPSGFAGGKFTELKPDLRMQALAATVKLNVVGGEVVKQAVGPATVGAIAVNTDDKTSQLVPIVNGAIDWTVPAGHWQVQIIEHQFRTSPTRSDTNPKRTKDQSQSLQDYLDPAATEQYLAFTHEQYKRAMGGEFGKTIMGFRGDEPDYSISGLPWTPAFFDRFQQMKGYDVRPFVPYFFAPAMTDRQQRARADYSDVFATMFAEAFFKVQGDWCAANHLEYQVHLNHEEMQMQLVHSEGDFFRDMRYVQVPGIDSIWHQIWTDTVSDFPRLASSVSHVYGKPRAFTESFAAYRPLPNVEQARYILNEQFVRGVNLVEAMYFPSTSAGPRPAPSFMGEPGFADLMQYTRRLSYLMSMGQPTASVALYLPTSSLWLGDAAADTQFVSAERLLSEHQVDFDIVDENALGRELIAGPGTLTTLSGNSYRTVILPAPRILSEAEVARLKVFAASGGHVLFLGGSPTLISGKTILDARPAVAADFNWATIEDGAQLSQTPTPPAQPPTEPPAPQDAPAAVVAAVAKAIPQPDLALDAPDTSLRYTRRRLKDATVYLFFNESGRVFSHEVRLMAQGGKAEVWDPQTGAVKRLAASRAAGAMKIQLSLQPYATEVVVIR